MRMEQSLMQLAEEKLSHKGLLEMDSYINIHIVSSIFHMSESSNVILYLS
jgi:hypothetical protein